MVLFPIVGLGAMAVIPTSDFCDGLPVTGADTSTFLKTFTTTNDIMEVNRSIVSIMTDCFTKPDGVLWNVVNLDRKRLLQRLQRYDLSKIINPLFFEYALNTDKRDLTCESRLLHFSSCLCNDERSVFGRSSLCQCSHLCLLPFLAPACFIVASHLLCVRADAFTNHIDMISRMTSDNKIYGYDSMPYDVRPTSAQYLDMHGDKRIYMFQRGGVIQVRRCPPDDQIAHIYVYILYIIYQCAHAPQCPAKFPIQIDRSCFGCSQNKAL
jgi:hypothetical protein